MILRPWVVLLAAGASRRFGGPKLLARLSGETLLRRGARVALAPRPAGVVVVLGARATRMQRELRGLPVQVVINRRWRSGMASSLRTAIRALPTNATAALVLLADQIAIGPADLALLIAAWQRQPRAIVTARADAIRCPPAMLPRHTVPALCRLRGDTGARKILADPGRRVIEFEMPRAVEDVDRPADLGRAPDLTVIS
jgi:molybdenum cofactor cytidylyltransferase